MTQDQIETFRHQIGGSFNYGNDDPEALVSWVLDEELPERIKGRENFRRTLREVLDVPGTVTPSTFESWTDNYEMDTQEKVQKVFQKLWDACFEGKVIEDWELDG